jgi:hypothetical protein
MKTNIINIALKRDLNEIVSNPKNITRVSKGDVSGNSIEVEFKEPVSFSSYTYYDNENNRDKDLTELENLIQENGR